MQKFLKIGAYFRSKREEMGFTQEEVSRSLGYTSKQIVSNWERGVCSPPLNQLSSLVKLLDMDQDKVVDLFMTTTREELLQKMERKPRILKKA